MNPDLREQLKSYSMVAGAVVGISVGAHSQIQYTDINPDVVLQNFNVNFLLDLNNDFTVDFRIGFYTYSSISTFNGRTYTYQSASVYMSNLGSAAINTYTKNITTNYGGFLMRAPLAHKANVAIDASKNWNSGTTSALLGWNYLYAVNQVPVSSFLIGQWPGKKDHYLGLKLTVGGKSYYGWARLDVDSFSHSVTIKDYAINTIANKPILTGDTIGTITSLNGTVNDAWSVYSFANRIYIITTKPLVEKAAIRVIDLLGKTIASGEMLGQKYQMQLKGIPSGFYVVELQTVEGVLQKKLFISTQR